MSKSKDFRFHVPVELVKSDDEDVWRVKGIASTPDQDLQGEVVDQQGLDISALKAGRGLFNWDHKNEPENILGQIEDADFVDVDGKKVLQVEGYLFRDNDRSKGFYSIMKGIKKGTGPRVHMSIEGKILERDFMNAKKIKKAKINKVALTLDPVNPYTYAELVKSLTATEGDNTPEQPIENTEETMILTRSEFQDAIRCAVEKALITNGKAGETQPNHDLIENSALKRSVEIADHNAIAEEMRKKHKELQSAITKAFQDFEKALAAGASTGAPTTRTGGEATQRESLEKEPKVMTYKEKMKKDKKSMVKSIVTSLKKAHPDHDPWELAEMVIEAFMIRNLKESHSD